MSLEILSRPRTLPLDRFLRYLSYMIHVKSEASMK